METFQGASIGQPVTLAQTRRFDLPGGDGVVRRLFVYVPKGDAPPEGWPLLVMTDGNAMIASAVDAVQVQSSYPTGTNVQPGVVVAIGYPTDDAYDPLHRSFDLSPPPGRTYPPFSDGAPPVLTGGADRFLRFIEEEAMPFVDGLAPIDKARRTLFGHSFGGLFALHALFTGCGTFSRYVAASPTVYWEDGLLLNSEKRFTTLRRKTALVVHLSAGEFEGETLAPFQYGREDTEKRIEHAGTAQTLSLTEAMAARLGDVPGLDVTYERYPGETHMTMLPIAVSRAVRVAFRMST